MNLIMIIIYININKATERMVALGGFGLVLGGIEVEESFVESSFLLPVTYQVLDAVLLMGHSYEEFLFVVQKELKFLFSSIQSTFLVV